MRKNGFTLVELLVTLSVMALLASAVTLTMGGGGSKVGSEAARFASRVAATRDQAILGGTAMGIWVSPSGYGFERFEAGGWQPWEARPLVQRDWAKGIVPSLGESSAQRIRFDPVGLPSEPSAVTLAGDDRSVRVTVDATGEVSVK